MGKGYQSIEETHVNTDYSNSRFLKRMGMKNPRPVVYGTELMVVCECGTFFNREEALDMVGHLPTPEEIYEEGQRLRENARIVGRAAPMTGIRVIPTIQQGQRIDV